MLNAFSQARRSGGKSDVTISHSRTASIASYSWRKRLPKARIARHGCSGMSSSAKSPSFEEASLMRSRHRSGKITLDCRCVLDDVLNTARGLLRRQRLDPYRFPFASALGELVPRPDPLRSPRVFAAVLRVLQACRSNRNPGRENSFARRTATSMSCAVFSPRAIEPNSETPTTPTERSSSRCACSSAIISSRLIIIILRHGS